MNQELEAWFKLWKDYTGGQMVFLGGFAFLTGFIAIQYRMGDHYYLMAILGSLYVAAGAVSFQIERLREEMEEEG